MKLEDVIAELEGIEREWGGHALAEKLDGNVVKEAHYKGTATGVRIAINVINERVSELPHAELVRRWRERAEKMRMVSTRSPGTLEALKATATSLAYDSAATELEESMASAT